MNAKIGFDGKAPEFMPVRDIAGQGKREALSIQNINIDRLEWLLARKHIDTAQHAAGRKLQQDNELCQIGGYATIEGGKGGGSGTNRLSDVKCDAISRMNDARVYVGNGPWRILELVVLDNVSVGKAEGRMRLKVGHGMGMLLAALDTLARHYKLA